MALKEPTRERLRNLGLLVLRLGFGLPLMLQHGLGKAVHFVHGQHEFADPLGLGSTASLGLASFGELFGGLLVVVGFFPRFGAFSAATTMAVAFFVQQAGDPFGQRELAFVYLVGFLAVLVMGGGKWSVDGWRRKKA